MVVAYTFQDVIDILPETKTFSLPAFKPTPLKIEYVKDTVSLCYHLIIACFILTISSYKRY